MRFRSYILPSVLFVLLGSSCADFSVSRHAGIPTLQAEDVEVANAWLRIHVEDAVNTPIALRRNGQVILSLAVAPIDTLVVDDSLLPKHDYLYQLGASPIGSLGTLAITTMDTTSHQITWYIDTIASGRVQDVTIVNDNLIYAVGDMYTKDPISQLDTVPRNAAVWNGTNWTLLAIPIQQPSQPPYPPGYCQCSLEGIISFSDTSVWPSGGTELIRWNGSRVTQYLYAPGTISHLWGSSPTNIYGVGYPGEVSHFNGVSWVQVPTGTTTTVNDVWGSVQSGGSGLTVLCAVSEPTVGSDRKILRINANNTAQDRPWTAGFRPQTIWFGTHQRIFIGGSGFVMGTFETGWQEITGLPNYFVEKIRGVDVNDVFAVGDFGFCGHFNGMTWRNYPEVGFTNGVLSSCAVRNRMIVAVGLNGSSAVVVRGYRER